MKRIGKAADAAMKNQKSATLAFSESDTGQEARPAVRHNVSSARLDEIKALIDRLVLDGLRGAPEHDLLDGMALTWERHLTRHGVPTEAFETLYETAVELRVRDRNEKRHTGPFDIEDLCAPWDGMKSLFANKAPPRSAEGCQRCYGTEWETIVVDGYATAKRCNHQPLLEEQNQK